MRRREFIAMLGGAAAAVPIFAQAQQRPLPIVALVAGGAAGSSAHYASAFRQGLKDSGYVEDQNVRIEYHWLDGQYDKLPALMADLVHRQVAVIATPANRQASLAAKAATATIPIVFGIAADPVQLGLVASLARPAGNATGFNFFGLEVNTKRFRMLHDLVPKAVRIAVLVNPANASTAAFTLHDLSEVAPTLGLELISLNASNSGEFDSAFAALHFSRYWPLAAAPVGNSRGSFRGQSGH